MPRVNRRKFWAALATASLAALSASRVYGANDRVRLGFVGLGNRGDRILDCFLAEPDAEVVAIADLHAPYLDFAAAKIGGSPARYADYRKLLDHPGIAQRTRTFLDWDAALERFTNNERANALLDYRYRKPYDAAQVAG